MEFKNEVVDFKIKDKVERLQKRLALVLGILVLVFVAIQFVVLSVVGVRGDDLSTIRSLQEQQRIENEILRADLMQSQVSSQIKGEAESVYGMKEVKLHVIDTKTPEVSALNR